MNKFLDWIARHLTIWMTISAVVTLISLVVVLAAPAGIDWGDAPAWAAFVVSLAGLGVAVHAAVSSRAAAQAAQTSAQTGIRQAAAAEEQVAIARRALELAEQQAHDTDSPIHTEQVQQALTQEPPYVAWWLEQRSKNTYLLRNIGTATAREVEIDQSRIRCPSRGTGPTSEVAPGASVEILLMAAFGAPKPNEIWVRWFGHPDWKAIPVQ